MVCEVGHYQPCISILHIGGTYDKQMASKGRVFPFRGNIRPFSETFNGQNGLASQKSSREKATALCCQLK